MSSLVAEVAQKLKVAGLAVMGQRVLVGVSGGLDSIVLLDLLSEAGFTNGIQLEVAHFNHGFRGSASTADAEFVRAAALDRKLPFHLGTLSIEETGELESESMEMAGRRYRHKFLAERAQELGIQTIALGHHAGDQVETVFLRLFRGEGSSLGGMKLMGPSPASSRVRLFRPMLGLKREQLAAWALHRGLAFREDLSNQDESFIRNRIRRSLLPLIIREFGIDALDGILRASGISGAMADWTEMEARKWLKGSFRPAFEELPIALQRGVIRIQLLDLKVETTFPRIEWLRLNAGEILSIGPETRIRRTAGGLVQSAPIPKKMVMDTSSLRLALVDGGQSQIFGGVSIDLRLVGAAGDGGRPSLGRTPGIEQFDADAVGEFVTLRHWRAGDRFQPIGMKSSVKLQDLFVSAKIPATQRRQLVVAEADGRGIFWVEGLRIAEGFKLQSPSVRYLEWRWERRDAFLAAAHSTC